MVVMDTITQVDLAEMRRLESERLISINKHEKYPLLIFNYTPVCQYTKTWTDLTRMCRGLITDLEGNIVCKPFPKFFNIGEHEDPNSKLPKLNWDQPFTCTKKEDGSLGILYPTPEGYKIATRGSFTSDQAIKAIEIFYKKGYDKHNYSKVLTYLFEIVYPANRIVVDYGEMEDLILLEILDTETGYATSWERTAETAKAIGCPMVDYMALSAENIQRLNEYYNETNGSKEEGLVIRFNDGMRVKVKYEEYVRLHRLITGCSSKTIWEHLKNNQSLEELLDRVPDEFYDWVKATSEDLQRQYKEIERDCQYDFGWIFGLHGKTRKEFAENVQKHRYKGILFAILDKKDVAPIIWRLLKPAYSKPFHQDIDA